MNQNIFDSLANELNSHADLIIAAKRPDYTRENTDVLANFKETADFCGITPLQAWLVHFYKQFSAVARYVKTPTATPSESIDSRFADLRNYLQLGYALHKEEQARQAETHLELDGTEPHLSELEKAFIAARDAGIPVR